MPLSELCRTACTRALSHVNGLGRTVNAQGRIERVQDLGPRFAHDAPMRGLGVRARRGPSALASLTRAVLITIAALTAIPALADSPPAVDESGLRYFARSGDRERLAAEIARLEALHPGWTPPADPLADAPARDPEVEAIWSLVGDGKPREARAAVVALTRERPDWQPPADLTARIDLAENRARLVNASDAKQPATVVSVAAENPELLTCADIDVLWRVAEAFSATDRPDRATDVYTYILDTCTAAPDRLASIEKASLVLDRPYLDTLLARERPDASGAPEFTPLRLELARRAVAVAGCRR
jgi:hypothetical protein